MTRCEDTIIKFFFEGLRKILKKKDLTGLGLTVLQNRLMNRNFRPALPKQLYPSLKKLIGECWDNTPANRPTFDDIVRRLGGEITIEVNQMREPDVTVYDDPDAAAAASTQQSPEEEKGTDDVDHDEGLELVSLRKCLAEEKEKAAQEREVAMRAIERATRAEEETSSLYARLTQSEAWSDRGKKVNEEERNKIIAAEVERLVNEYDEKKYNIRIATSKGAAEDTARV